MFFNTSFWHIKIADARSLKNQIVSIVLVEFWNALSVWGNNHTRSPGQLAHVVRVPRLSHFFFAFAHLV